MRHLLAPRVIGLLAGLVGCSGLQAPEPKLMLNQRQQIPSAWRCSPLFYGAGAADGCDCDCGAPDPDCVEGARSAWCYDGGRMRSVSRCDECGPPGPR